MRIALQHKMSTGQEDEVYTLGVEAAGFLALVGALIAGGPTIQSAITARNWGQVSAFAGAAAGPFTVHFWAPMSKWLISGANFLDLERPIDKVCLIFLYRIGMGLLG